MTNIKETGPPEKGDDGLSNCCHGDTTDPPKYQDECASSERQDDPDTCTIDIEETNGKDNQDVTNVQSKTKTPESETQCQDSGKKSKKPNRKWEVFPGGNNIFDQFSPFYDHRSKEHPFSCSLSSYCTEQHLATREPFQEQRRTKLKIKNQASTFNKKTRKKSDSSRKR